MFEPNLDKKTGEPSMLHRHVEGNVLIKHGKLKKHASKNFYTNHPCNMQNFLKLRRISRNFIKHVNDFEKNIPDFHKILQEASKTQFKSLL